MVLQDGRTWRRPGHPVGWIFTAAGMVEAVDFASFKYGLAAAAGRGLPAGEHVGWLQLWIWAVSLSLSTVKDGCVPRSSA